MKKFQIFLFIEACLLTGALILMVSRAFRVSADSIPLAPLLYRKRGNNLVATIPFFHRHAQSHSHSYLQWQLSIVSFFSINDESKKGRTLVFWRDWWRLKIDANPRFTYLKYVLYKSPDLPVWLITSRLMGEDTNSFGKSYPNQSWQCRIARKWWERLGIIDT